MSKAERLRKIKEEKMKNDEAFRKKEEKRKEASAEVVGKFVKKESIWYKIIKFIMILPFLYSGFFYGLITAINIFKKWVPWIDNTYIGVLILISVIAMLIAVILAFKRLYLASFIISLVSTSVYFFITKKHFVDYLTGRVTENGDIHPEYEFMIRHYPILLFLLCSFILFIMTVFTVFKKKKKEKAKRDNAPTKSIVDY